MGGRLHGWDIPSWQWAIAGWSASQKLAIGLSAQPGVKCASWWTELIGYAVNGWSGSWVVLVLPPMGKYVLYIFHDTNKYVYTNNIMLFSGYPNVAMMPDTLCFPILEPQMLQKTVAETLETECHGSQQHFKTHVSKLRGWRSSTCCLWEAQWHPVE